MLNFIFPAAEEITESSNQVYVIELYICITSSIYFALPIWVSVIALMQSLNGAQLLNITLLLLVSTLFAAAPAPAQIIVIVTLYTLHFIWTLKF